MFAGFPFNFKNEKNSPNFPNYVRKYSLTIRFYNNILGNF